MSHIDYHLVRGEAPQAEKVAGLFDQLINDLCMYPDRGHRPPELAAYPDAGIKEIHVGSLRVIYRIAKDSVYILFIVHGRRAIDQELMARAFKISHYLPSD